MYLTTRYSQAFPVTRSLKLARETAWLLHLLGFQVPEGPAPIPVPSQPPFFPLPRPHPLFEPLKHCRLRSSGVHHHWRRGKPGASARHWQKGAPQSEVLPCRGSRRGQLQPSTAVSPPLASAPLISDQTFHPDIMQPCSRTAATLQTALELRQAPSMEKHPYRGPVGVL